MRFFDFEGLWMQISIETWRFPLRFFDFEDLWVQISTISSISKDSKIHKKYVHLLYKIPYSSGLTNNKHHSSKGGSPANKFLEFLGLQVS